MRYRYTRRGTRRILGTDDAMAIETVLLDIDGTLVDSNDAHAAAWHDAFTESGHTIAAGTVRPLIGMGGDKIIPLLVPGLDAHMDQGKAIAQRRKLVFSERYLAHVAPTRGARELVSALRDRGLKIVIATSAKPDGIAPLLRAARLEDACPS